MVLEQAGMRAARWRTWSRSATITLIVLGCISTGAGVAAASSPESDLLRLVNKERARVGVRSLAWDSSIARTAERHSVSMADDGKIYHSQLRASAFDAAVVGENVGRGPSLGSLIEAFMRSPSHKQNILDKEFSRTGIGVVSKGSWLYVTQIFASRAKTDGVGAVAPAPRVKKKRAVTRPSSRPVTRPQAEAPARKTVVRRPSRPTAERSPPPRGRLVDLQPTTPVAARQTNLAWIRAPGIKHPIVLLIALRFLLAAMYLRIDTGRPFRLDLSPIPARS